MAASFHPIATISQTELALRVDVPSITFDPGTMIPSQGTAMRDCDSVLRHRNDFWLDYTFSRMVEAPDGFVRLIFVKAKTSEERNVAYKTTTTYQDHPWPDVLKSLIFQEDTVFRNYGKTPDPLAALDGGALVLASSWYVRKAYIPGLTYNSEVTVEYFLSDHTPFTAREMNHQQPVPTEVEWDFNGSRGSMTCLHSEVRIASKGRPYTIAYLAAQTQAAAPVIPERVFPKTNFESWAAFVLDDGQKEDPTTGQWIRTRYTIKPPPEPKLIIV